MKPSSWKKSGTADSMGLRMLLSGMALLSAALIGFGIYTAARMTARRISADYYFPFLKAARSVENTIADQTLLTQSKFTLARALRSLMAENSMLAAEQIVVSDLKKENAELRSLLKLSSRSSFRPVFAEVLTRNPMSWQEKFTIDKGSLDGIEPGNLAVASVFSEKANAPAIAVVGKVKSVSRHSAEISTILSQDFQLSVSLPATKSSGILEGMRHFSEQHATLKFLPLNAAPAPDQLVCTNSFSGNNPPGIPVGQIVAVETTSRTLPHNRLYLETEVRPFVSPAMVRFVAVFAREKK